MLDPPVIDNAAAARDAFVLGGYGRCRPIGVASKDVVLGRHPIAPRLKFRPRIADNPARRRDIQDETGYDPDVIMDLVLADGP